MYELKKDYRDNAALRHSFNELAKQTFLIDFEDWYQNGLWTGHYNPYSIVKDGEVIANVSVNRTDMVLDGNIKHFLQLGTIMTAGAYRRQGFVRELMMAVRADYAGKTDGVYLFANDSVLGFYPKFGFRKAPEYQYSKKLSGTGPCQFVKTPMYGRKEWGALAAAIKRNVFRGRLDLVDNAELFLFYVTKYMQEDVYYHAGSDTYVIAEREGGKLLLHNIFSGTLCRLPEVLALFGQETEEIILGFVPAEEGFTAEQLHEEDCTFFIYGDGLSIFEEEKLRIPSLAHA